MTSATVERPSFTGFHHWACAVRDVARSAAWYERVLGLIRTPQLCPQDGEHGSVLLSDPESGIAVALHPAGGDEPGGHIAFAVSSRSQLDTWAIWLDGLGVAHEGVADVEWPEPYAYLVFHDLDDVPLVLVHVAG